ncbi:ROK family transcriptional regulator [Microbacterium radiodurans]|uniref:ROK family transcriptional regulator n=2 Tax=Microbacterium radiodurans TaxID=661398 RepID=A0A5J5IU29_9MICO|nr:ROK family transcriptional regulator [Microbacterium radiodurans]
MMSDSEAALARAVLIHGPLSRRDLTARLGLSAASLTRLAKPLLDSGLLIELDDVADGSIGRPSRPLDIAPDAGRFVGIKLTGDQLVAVGTDIRAEPVAALERTLTDRSPDAVSAAIVDAVGALDLPGIVGVGISLGGNVRDGVVRYADFLGWGEVDLAGRLEPALGVPVTVENDLVALTEAERWFGAGRGLPGFTTITIGAGVGYGLVVAGEVVRTADASVGTGGHIPLDPYGPLCSGGHRGCAQAMLSSGSITAQVSAALGRPVGYAETLALAADGEAVARSVVAGAGRALGRFIALAANLSLQSTVVLAGEGIGLFGVAEAEVRAEISAGRDPEATPVDIHVDDSGFRAWARGAAAVAVQAAMARMQSAR